MRKILSILAILVLASCGGSSPPITTSAPTSETMSRKEVERSAHQKLDPLISEMTKKKNRPPAASAAPRAPSSTPQIPLEPPTAGIRIGKESTPKVIKKTPKTQSDDVLDQLSLASMSFNTPAQINIKETGKAKFIVDLTLSPQELEKSLNKQGKTTSGKILVSKILTVEIIATGLQVEEITPYRQALSSTEPTVWEWELIPTKPGEFEIYLVVSAEVWADDTRAYRRIKTFENVVKVEITATQQALGWVEKYWQWVWTAMLLPLGVWGWKRWRKEKE